MSVANAERQEDLTRNSAKLVRLERARAEVMDEAQAGEDEGGCTHELVATSWCWVIPAIGGRRRRWEGQLGARLLVVEEILYSLEDEEGVKTENDRVWV